MPPGDVVVPGQLARPLARLATIGAEAIQRDSGGLPLVPGMAGLIAELDTSASGPALGSVGAGQSHPVSAAGSWLTVDQAAGLAGGISCRHVRRLARLGHLIARRTGRDWQISRQSAEDYGKARHVA
jgi:excisionase family DNA binding protein